MKKYLLITLIILFFLLWTKSVFAVSISNITLDPTLDISYFGNYTLSSTIADYPTTDPVTLNLSGINGDEHDDWIYYAHGTGASPTLTFDMIHDSGAIWKKTYIRPDHIYPSILFAPLSLSWGTAPLDINARRNSYHLYHFINAFTITGETNFWVEINTTPVSMVNSADLLVYLVRNNKAVSFFNADWRNSSEVELIGSISRNDTYDHEHSDNSSHHLIRLSANAGKRFGTKNLDIGSDFWIILYNTSPNTNRGWNLKYHPSALCNNSNGWYLANQTGWTTTGQAGCPDVHVHFARRDIEHMDGVKATVTAGSISEIQELYFGALPNLPPNSTTFTNPLRGTYGGLVNVTWEAASDPNSDPLKYNLYLLNEAGESVKTLATNLETIQHIWDTTAETDGSYSLKGTVCDASLCSEYFSQPFTIDNTDEIYSLSSITMSSNNSNPLIAVTGNTVSLIFTSSGTITAPNVLFYSGGEAVNNQASTVNTAGNNWVSTYTVSTSDTNGQVTFVISGSHLAAEYTEVTSGSYVTVNIPQPTSAATNASTAAGNTEAKAPSCGDQKPTDEPDLFQIDTSSSKAVLYYKSINKPLSDYYIAFGDKSNDYQHGTFTGRNQTEGVVSYRVNHLKPNTFYYFRVRGQNGCMPGDWGNEMKIKTGYKGKVSYASYYKNFLVRTKAVLTKLTKNITSPEKELPKKSGNIKKPTPNMKITPASKAKSKAATDNKLPVKKSCFLWFCR